MLALGLGLAAAAVGAPGADRRFLVVLAVIVLAWAAADVREVVHQVDELRSGIAVLAAFGAVAAPRRGGHRDAAGRGRLAARIGALGHRSGIRRLT